MANWQSALTMMLPPRGGLSARVSDTFKQHLARKSKGGTDMVYGVGSNVTRSHPPCYSPIAGKVVSAGTDAWNTVTIIDADGNRHGFLHMHKVDVKAGQTIAAGTLMGWMGGVGPGPGGMRYQGAGLAGKNATAFDPHLHYQLTLKGQSRRTDAVAWWDKGQAPGETTTEAAPPLLETPAETVDDKGKVEQPAGVAPPPEPARPLMPSQASEANASAADKALWTNRVPNHEPWPRTLKAQPQKDPGGTQAYDDEAGMIYQESDEPARQDLNRHHTDEFPPESAWVGRAEGDVFVPRNPLWKR